MVANFKFRWKTLIQLMLVYFGGVMIALNIGVDASHITFWLFIGIIVTIPVWVNITSHDDIDVHKGNYVDINKINKRE